MSKPYSGPMHLGWHFCAMNRGKPVLRDGTRLVIGKIYEHRGRLQMCRSGYHDAERVIDALQYAPGSYLCRTLASVDQKDTNKRLSRVRIALAGMDANHTLHLFAVRIAYCALLAERERGREPDSRSWNVLRVKQAWLRGEASDSQLSAADSAAYSAAYLAADSAARSAADSAARSAACSAAYSAAYSAADSAARSAADSLLLSMLPHELVEAGDE